MRDIARIGPIMEYLWEVWERNPDWRLTQLLVNTGIVPNIPGMWYYTEDDVYLEGIKRLEEEDA